MNNRLYKLMNWPEVEEIIYSDGDNPHRILGAHKVGNSLLFQAFFPDAKEVSVRLQGDQKAYPMELADEAGFFAALVPYRSRYKYSYLVTAQDGTTRTVYDPYAFQPITDREDCIKFASGIHYDARSKLGAHPMLRGGRYGVNFVTWAPDAARVSVIGAFNKWDGRVCQMCRVDPSGIFEIFIPGIEEGEEYQYEIKTRDNQIFIREDPYALEMGVKTPHTSVVREEGDFEWTDDAWIGLRPKYDREKQPLSICELSLDTFVAQLEARKEDGRAFREQLAENVLEFVRVGGFNAVEFMPVMAHLEEDPYAVTAFWALSPRYGGAEDFQYLVNELHRAGIRVLLDFTATFFPEENRALRMFDGRPLYEYQDAQRSVQPGSGYIVFDYGRKEVAGYLIACALYWIHRYHADGLRLTDVSKSLYLDYDRGPGEWTPNIYGSNENLEAEEFFRHLNAAVHEQDAGLLTIAKETACHPQVTDSVENGGLGFDYKWNNGWTRDLLAYLRNDPLFRAPHHNELTFSMIYSYTERFILEFSHEDITGLTGLAGQMPGDEAAREANLRFALCYLMTHPGRKMLFYGQTDLPAAKRLQLHRFLHDLNMMYYEHAALYEQDDLQDGFEWINCMAAEECMLSFVRRDARGKDSLLVVCNMAGVERELSVGVPVDGKYTEIMNTNRSSYGGSETGMGGGAIETRHVAVDGREHSIELHLAPLSIRVFSYAPYTEQERRIRQVREEAGRKIAAEQTERREALAKELQEEEAKLLKELRERYERELTKQQEAIAEKYEKIEEEQIFHIISDAAYEQLQSGTVKRSGRKRK